MANASTRLNIDLKQRIGLHPDLAPFTEPSDAWSDGRNVRFEDGYTRSAHGRVQFYAALTDAPALWADTVISNSQAAYIVFCTATKIYRIGAGDPTPVDVTPSGWAAGAPLEFFGVSAGGLMFVASRQNNPVSVASGLTPTTAVALPDWTNYFGANNPPLNLAAARQFLFAIGTQNEPQIVYWSDVMSSGSPPPAWQPSLSNLAGSVECIDTDGPLIAGRELQGEVMVYKSHTTYRMRFVAGNFIWSRRALFNQVGCISPEGVAALQDFHCVLADNDVILHDGGRVKSLTPRKIRRTMFNQIIDPLACQVQTNPSRQEIWVLLNTKEDAYKEKHIAWIYDLATEEWGMRELGPSQLSVDDGKRATFAFRGFQPTGDPEPSYNDLDQVSYAEADFPYVGRQTDPVREALFTAEGDGFWRVDDGREVGQPGQSMMVRVEGIALDEQERRFAVLRRITLIGDIGGDADFDVRIGTQTEAANPIAWSGPLPFTEPRSWVGEYRGRYHSFELTEKNGSTVNIHRIRAEYTLEGDE